MWICDSALSLLVNIINMSVNEDLVSHPQNSIVEDPPGENEEVEVNNFSCHPQAALHRYSFLFFLCALGFGK